VETIGMLLGIVLILMLVVLSGVICYTIGKTCILLQQWLFRKLSPMGKDGGEINENISVNR